MKSKLKFAVSTIATFAAATTPMLAQSTNNIILSPFSVGDQSAFAATILNINLLNFFGGARSNVVSFSSSTNNNSNGSSTNNVFANISANLNTTTTTSGNTTDSTVITSNRSFVNSPLHSGVGILGNTARFNTAYAANTPSGNSTIIQLTALTDSSFPRVGSAGVAFTGFTNPVTQVAFQYSPLSTVSGFTNPDLYDAPYLAIDDSSGRTKYFPITQGLVTSNYALNTLNSNIAALNGSSSSSTTKLDNAFISVVFNTAQLGIQGNVTNVGLVQFKRGIVFLKDMSVNGAVATKVFADTSHTYPF